MSNRSAALAAMPDIASIEHLHPQGTLDWVGMSDVHVPIRVSDGGVARSVTAKAQIYVNLEDPQAKGIHMSRLYLMLDESAGAHALTPAMLSELLGDRKSVV